jgi:fido (protein-threonine AMPylation protein)
LDAIFADTNFDHEDSRVRVWSEKAIPCYNCNAVFLNSANFLDRIVKSKAEVMAHAMLVETYINTLWTQEFPPAENAGNTRTVLEKTMKIPRVLRERHLVAKCRENGIPDSERVAKKIFNVTVSIEEFIGAAPATFFDSGYTESLSLETVSSVHRLAMVGLLDEDQLGSFRTVDVCPSGSAFRYANPSSIGPRLTTLMCWTNDKLTLIQWASTDKLPMAIRLGAVFFREFLLIHPFKNGNGRTARLLLSMILKGFCVFPITLEAERAKYIEIMEDCNPGVDGMPKKGGYSPIAISILLSLERSMGTIGFSLLDDVEHVCQTIGAAYAWSWAEMLWSWTRWWWTRRGCTRRQRTEHRPHSPSALG